MKTIDKNQIETFQNKVRDWYAKNQVILPWRQTTNPYKILISEVMLQQTQVSRVKEYFEKWIKKWPNIHSLARASNKEVLQMWSGLGYNSRALRLKKLAEEVSTSSKYNGGLPTTREELLSLPGIGPYISAAILAFAHNQVAPVVDTNIRRILIDEFNLPYEVSMKELEELAIQVTPQENPREWNNALMDYGRLHKTARKTKISPLTKQSKFEGSTRQVRSNIVKHLLNADSVPLKKLKEKYKHKEFDNIVAKMQKETLITIHNGKVELVS